MTVKKRKSVCQQFKQFGFSLIEVLIALTILSVGLLGAAGLNLYALRHNQQAYWQSIATIQLASMLDRLRANQLPAAHAYEIKRWNQVNAKLLPMGKGTASCSRYICRVTLQWGEQKSLSISSVV